MKRGLIVINGYFENASSAAQWQGIKAALEARGAAADVKKSNEISLGIRGEGVFAELPAYDFCVFLDKDVTAALMLEKLGMKLFNGAEAIRLCDDKMLTYAALAGRGIPMPETIASPLMYRENEDDAFLNRVSARLGFPVVVKKCYGSMGQGVFLAKDRRELGELFAHLRLFPHLYQKFTGKGGEDVRVLTVGGKFFAAIRRVNEGDFRSNIECGGRGIAYLPSPEQIRLAEEVSAVLRLSYAGVDLLTDGGKNYLCEVNSNAFFSGLQRATGKDVAAAYAEYILQNV